MQRYCAAVESKPNICPAGRARVGGLEGALKTTLPIKIAAYHECSSVQSARRV